MPYFLNVEKKLFVFFGHFQFEVAQIRGVLHFLGGSGMMFIPKPPRLFFSVTPMKVVACQGMIYQIGVGTPWNPPS